MSEKEKGKSHPFAGHLRPTEEVLWLSSHARKSKGGRWGFSQREWRMISIIAVIVAALLMIGLTIMPPLALVALALMTLVVASFWILLIWGLMRLSQKPANPNYVYAITNERLLYRKKQNVASISLEHVPVVTLFRGKCGKGTFSFGALFPMWPDVENAVEVKHMIDEAQKNRVKELTQ